MVVAWQWVGPDHAGNDLRNWGNIICSFRLDSLHRGIGRRAAEKQSTFLVPHVTTEEDEPARQCPFNAESRELYAHGKVVLVLPNT